MSKRSRAKEIITIGAVAVATAHLVWPSLAIDSIVFGCIILAAIPWLAPILRISKIEVAGLGAMEMKVEEVKKEVTLLSGQTSSSRRLALTAMEDAEASKRSFTSSASQSHDELFQLARRYEQILATGNDASESAIAEIVVNMKGLGASLGQMELRSFLKSERPGDRMIAYAHLYASPEIGLMQELIESLIMLERTTFGQYWAIFALDKCKQRSGSIMTDDSVKRLKNFLKQLPPGSARQYELGRVLGTANEDEQGA